MALSAPAWLTAGPRPVLMAIGDSFLNGMRSMTIDDALAALSIPAEVGRALAPPPGFAPFSPARYPRPVLLDGEGLLRRHVTIPPPLPLSPQMALAQLAFALPKIKATVLRNARDWIGDAARPVPAVPQRFDNLAIAGARLPDLFGATYAQVDARWAAMRTAILAEDDPFAWSGALDPDDPYADDRAYADQPGPFPGDKLLGLKPGWGVADVHITLNARHLMNPSGAAGLEGFRVIDIVHARQPQVLMINIGPNHGLPEICMGGQGERGIARLKRFASLWPRCAAELAATPGLELGVVLLPPQPSQIPALMPPQRLDTETPPPAFGARYHASYVSAMTVTPGGRVYSRAEMEQFDRIVAEVSDSMRQAAEAAFAAAGKAVVFVDNAALIGAHDAKNGRGPAFQPAPPDGPRYDNRCIGIRRFTGPERLRGGICSLDNFHPSTLGYRFVARAVVEAIASRRPALVRALPAVTSVGDTLLTDPPLPAINMLSALWPFEDGQVSSGVADLGAMEGMLRMGGIR